MSEASFGNFQRLFEQSVSEIQTRLGLERGPIPDVLDAFCLMHASALASLHVKLEHYQAEVSLETAVGSFLDEHGAVMGLPRVSASFAQGRVRIKGHSGALVSQGTTLVNQKGQRYFLMQELTLPSSGADASGYVSLEAEVMADQSGSESNLAAPEKLFFSQKRSDLFETAEIVGEGISGGSSPEGDSAYRYRILEQKQDVFSRYGRSGDFAFWAKGSHSDVRYAHESPHSDVDGTLRIYCSGENYKKLDASSLSAVRTRLSKLAPLGVRWSVESPEPVPVSIHASVSPSSLSPEAVRGGIRSWFASLGDGVGSVFSSPLDEMARTLQNTLIRTLPEIETIAVEFKFSGLPNPPQAHGYQTFTLSEVTCTN